MGSHLDTQPTGGRYDGYPLVVNAGLEGVESFWHEEQGRDQFRRLESSTGTNEEEGAALPYDGPRREGGVWADAVPWKLHGNLA